MTERAVRPPTVVSLVDAIADSIVARQGMTNRDRAWAVLEVIDKEGWHILPKEEK